jgi:hypothetical protein
LGCRHFGENLRLLLSLSKKSKWPTLIILASLKINNLQATENGKMPRIKVFRQARYGHGKTGGSKSFDIQTIYAIPGGFPGVMTMAR